MGGGTGRLIARRSRSEPRYFPGVGDRERSLRACGKQNHTVSVCLETRRELVKSA
jgi:hypothetical protein